VLVREIIKREAETAPLSPIKRLDIHFGIGI
jgi:hypothetical protein